MRRLSSLFRRPPPPTRSMRVIRAGEITTETLKPPLRRSFNEGAHKQAR